MNQEIKLLDVVALLKAMPAQKLKAGQVGTVVEVFGDNDFEVEFVDKQGRTIAMLPLKKADLLVLQYEMEGV
ncbi:MAG: DUF4926 domain-containing protein [Saprospiraceae bacterium]